MSGALGASLTNTLILALTQCQDQVRIIEEQSARIERLQRENDRLRKELLDVKQARPAPPVPASEQSGSSQVEDLFHKNVEAQAEIHQLKKKLKAYKQKANGRLAVPLSSPLSLPTTPIASPPKLHSVSSAGGPRFEPEQSPPRKRIRLDDSRILHEVHPNTAHSVSPTTNAFTRSDLEKKATTIGAVAEDGEDYLPTTEPAESAKSPRASVNKETSGHRRLEGLLGAPTPSRVPLARPRSSTPSKSISNINHTSMDTMAGTRHSPATRSRLTSDTDRAFLGHSFRRDPEDEEPLRARPISKLSLQHFKPNPSWLDNHNISSDAFLHGPNANRMKVLAETLPKPPGHDHLTDNEILVDFLGPGTEARISSLTELAKKNLLAEAKVKRIAQSLKRPREIYDMAHDPPGFWSTDMPGTQEDDENKEKARKMEREEVKRRYEEAIRDGHGRWIFADE